MRRLATLIAMTLLLTLTASAQEGKRPRFSPEEFKARMEVFIAEKAELTQVECEKVFPIFHEMKEKQRELMQKEFKLKRGGAPADASEKDYQEMLTKIAELHEDAAKIEQSYYKKMCKVISAKKVYGIMRADDAFHREMLQHANNKPKHKGPEQ